LVAFDQTIAALSTPPGESGIAVVRMSGDEALAILARAFRTPSGKTFDEEWEHRRLYRGLVVGGDGAPIDDVMCAVMRAPDTYTGEDVVEISCHGSTVVVSRILETLYTLGARPAEAGEFTKRAFLAGKMDLIQAEAVADLIHAQSDLQRAVAQRQLAGALSERIDALADETLALLGVIEANIDFIEEGIDTLDVTASAETLRRHRRELDELLAGAELARPFREGYNVAIAGPVNAGKSSLFNRLVGQDRAIVTEIPGTTRDLLRETVLIDGLVFVFHDTAGLRGGRGGDAASDRVESIGIDRAEGAVRSADAVVFVLDGGVVPDDATLGRIGAVARGAAAVVALNKSDAWDEYPPPALAAVKALGAGVGCVTLSALTGEGVETLERTLVGIVGAERLAAMARERVVLNARLVALLKTAARKTDVLCASIEARRPLEMMAVEAREVLAQYEEATGRHYQDGLLDAIFSRFCIGK
jgi:tRNA modification GTPase